MYDYEYALRVSASVCTCAQFLSGFFICANFMKRGKVSNESVTPFVTGFLSCSLWLYYGMLKTNSTVVSVNVFGSLLFATYTWIYYKYTSKKKRVVHYVITAVAIITWIVYITDSKIHQSQLKVVSAELHKHDTLKAAAESDPELPDIITSSTTINDAIERVGLVCCLTTMLFFAAPLSSLIHVVKTRNTESMPMPMIIMTCLVSAQWYIYGQMLHDKFMMYPNAAGCVLSVIQLSLFIIYPRRSSISLTTSYNKLMDA